MQAREPPEQIPEHPSTKQRQILSFAYAVPIGTLGGLIGLGGAEFRLPVLVGPLGYPVRKAIPLNLSISLVTLTAALIFRSGTLSLELIEPLSTPIVSLIGGAVVAAFFGTGLAKQLSNDLLHRVILALLLGIGGLLIGEAFLPEQIVPLAPTSTLGQVAVGVLLGLLIGFVSSLLGVAGGELIIPTMVFVFGADIKTAGTASLLISLPTVCVGVLRYAKQGAFADRRVFKETVTPMGVGSVIGAAIGGLLVGFVPAGVLKLALGIILILSALRVFLAGGHSNTKA